MADTKRLTGKRGQTIPSCSQTAIENEAEAVQIEAEAVQAEGGLAEGYDEVESVETDVFEVELEIESDFEDEPGVEGSLDEAMAEGSLDEAMAEVEAVELAIEIADDMIEVESVPAPAKKPAKKSPRAKNPDPSA